MCFLLVALADIVGAGFYSIYYNYGSSAKDARFFFFFLRGFWRSVCVCQAPVAAAAAAAAGTIFSAKKNGRSILCCTVCLLQ